MARNLSVKLFYASCYCKCVSGLFVRLFLVIESYNLRPNSFSNFFSYLYNVRIWNLLNFKFFEEIGFLILKIYHDHAWLIQIIFTKLLARTMMSFETVVSVFEPSTETKTGLKRFVVWGRAWPSSSFKSDQLMVVRKVLIPSHCA